jgi:ferritin-like metal-binding protein YciE
MSMESLRDLYVEELKDLYSAESQLVKALPKMAKKASNDSLRTAFEEHLEVTRGHVDRLEEIFQDLDGSPRGKRCKGMAGLIEEGNDMMAEDAEPEVADAAIIAAAQKVEHYEIAAYGTVRTYAERLGLSNHARLLQQTLDEESEADERLTEIAERVVNPQAEG